MTKKHERYFYVAVAAITLVNVAFQTHRTPAPAGGAIAASSLPIGSSVPELHLRPLSNVAKQAEDPRVGGSGCHVLVVFHPRCPHCAPAALRESALPVRDRLPVIWIADADDSASAAFAKLLRAPSVLRYDPDAHRVLRTNVIPSAILVSADGNVRKVWGYEGTEDHQRLRRQC